MPGLAPKKVSIPHSQIISLQHFQIKPVPTVRPTHYNPHNPYNPLTYLSIGSEQEDSLLASLIHEGVRRNMIFVAPVGNNSHSDTVRFPLRPSPAAHPVP